jgi:hypothetical protein
MEGNWRGLIDAIFQNLPEETEKNLERPENNKHYA